MMLNLLVELKITIVLEICRSGDATILLRRLRAMDGDAPASRDGLAAVLNGIVASLDRGDLEGLIPLQSISQAFQTRTNLFFYLLPNICLHPVDIEALIHRLTTDRGGDRFK